MEAGRMAPGLPEGGIDLMVGRKRPQGHGPIQGGRSIADSIRLAEDRDHVERIRQQRIAGDDGQIVEDKLVRKDVQVHDDGGEQNQPDCTAISWPR